MVPPLMPLEKRELGTKLGSQKQEGAGPSCRALGILTHCHSQIPDKRNVAGAEVEPELLTRLCDSRKRPAVS